MKTLKCETCDKKIDVNEMVPTGFRYTKFVCSKCTKIFEEEVNKMFERFQRRVEKECKKKHSKN